MFRTRKARMLGLAMVLAALLAGTGSWMAIQAAGGQNGVSVKALNYDDQVRFVVEGSNTSILRAEVFDLAGKRLFDSGPTMGRALDWTMTTMEGDRVAHGVYLYVITAWDSGGQLLKSQVGKLALVPGGVGLGQAPALAPGDERPSPEAKEEQVRALAYSHTGDWTVSGKLGVGTDTPSQPIDVRNPADNARMVLNGNDIGWGSGELQILNNGDPVGRILASAYFGYVGFIGLGTNQFRVFTRNPALTSSLERLRITGGTDVAIVAFLNSNVGIGTASPTAVLEVKGSTANLLVLKDPPGNTVFRVERDGDVYADRAYHCGLSTGCFNAGTGADVAERIDTSEAVEPGDVVEIDPQNPGLYRKAREPHSTRVAGVISTAPAITLGNAFDPNAEKWEDSRPLLALAGRCR